MTPAPHHPDAVATGRSISAVRRSVDEEPATWLFDDARSLVPPRSLDELERLLAKRGGWYAAQQSTAPHRMIAVLEDLASAGHFPEADLAVATTLVTTAFLKEGVIRPSRYTFQLADIELPAPWTEAGRDLLRALMQQIRALGPVASWGQRIPGQAPSAPERLSAAAAAIQDVLINDSVERYKRWHDATDRLTVIEDGEAAAVALREPVELAEVRPQLARQIWRQIVHAVAYQEIADRYPLDGDRATREAHGAMLLDLTRRMLKERSGRVKSSTNALLSIAGLEVPTIPQRTKGFHQIAGRIGQFAQWLEPVAGTMIETTVKTGAELDGWRQQRRQLSAVVGATILSPIYVNAEEPPPEVLHPPQQLDARQHAEFRAAIEAEALRQGRTVADVLQEHPIRSQPVRLLRAHRASRLALQASRQWLTLGSRVAPRDHLQTDAYIDAWFASYGPWDSPTAETAARTWIRTGRAPEGWSPDDHPGTRLLAALAGTFTDDPERPMAPATALQATWAAAVTVAFTRGGREMDFARLQEGRLPLQGRQSGQGQGQGQGTGWEAPLRLPTDGLSLLQSAYLGASAWMAAERLAEASRRGTSLNTQPITDRRATATDPGVVVPTLGLQHGGGRLDGWAGTLTRAYIEAFADGQIVPTGVGPSTAFPVPELLADHEKAQQASRQGQQPAMVVLQPEEHEPRLPVEASHWHEDPSRDLGDGWLRGAYARDGQQEIWVVSGAAATRPDPMRARSAASAWLPDRGPSPSTRLAERVLAGLEPPVLGKTRVNPRDGAPKPPRRGIRR